MTMPREYTTPQRRWNCPHCQTTGWYTPGSSLDPRTNHWRASDGKRCVKATETNAQILARLLKSADPKAIGKNDTGRFA